MFKWLIVIFIFILFIVIIIFEQNHSILMDSKISKLQNEYEQLKNENTSMMYRINSILALEKLDKIAKEKNFFTPTEKEIINIKE